MKIFLKKSIKKLTQLTKFMCPCPKKTTKLNQIKNITSKTKVATLRINQIKVHMMVTCILITIISRTIKALMLIEIHRYYTALRHCAQYHALMRTIILRNHQFHRHYRRLHQPHHMQLYARLIAKMTFRGNRVLLVRNYFFYFFFWKFEVRLSSKHKKIRI